MDHRHNYLLILDVNGILIHREYQKNLDLAPPKGAYREGNFFVWLRPGLKDFLDYCFTNFEVAVWSSAAKHNLDPLVKEVFGKYYTRLVFVADQDYCQKVPPAKANSRTTTNYKSPKPLFLKNLDKVWAFSRLKNRYNATNTLIIDDSDEKMVNNPPECHFNPGTWTIDGSSGNEALLPSGTIRKRLAEYIEASNK